MIWQTFGPGAAALGVLALAGLLFALQRLRVRHTEAVVPTTLFWREAIEEARARVLTERFRHPLAYLLLLALAAALWVASGLPRAEDRGEQDVVLLFDGASDSEELRAELLAAAEAAPRDGRTVLWCGAEIETLLLPGEETNLLESRLEHAETEPAPSSLERALWELALEGSDRKTAVRVLGDGAIRADLLDRLPQDIDVARITAKGEATSRFTGLGVSSAASGQFEKVDVLVEASGPIEATLEGTPITGTPAGDAVLFTDLGAGRFEATSGDAEVRRDLPQRRRLQVLTGPSLPAPLIAALAADPAVQLVTEGGDVCVRRAGDGIGEGLPTFELVPPDAQDHAFELASPEEDSERALVEGVLALGLDRIDATALASRAGVVITAGARTAPVKHFAVWEELLGPGYDLVEGRTFPLLVGRTLRWLGDVRPIPAVVAAGEPTTEPLALASLGMLPIPPHAGEWVTSDGTVAVANLAARFEDAAPTGSVEASSGLDWTMVLAALALVMLLAEGVLYRTGRMP